jgi:hypothetical protein
MLLPQYSSVAHGTQVVVRSCWHDDREVIMTIHPHQKVPITHARPRSSRAAAPLALLALAVMLGIGVIAFSSIPQTAGVQVTTVGQKP